MSDDAPLIDTRQAVPELGTLPVVHVVITLRLQANDENYWRVIDFVAMDPTRTIYHESEAQGATSLEPTTIAANLIPAIDHAVRFLTPMI